MSSVSGNYSCIGDFNLVGTSLPVNGTYAHPVGCLDAPPYPYRFCDDKEIHRLRNATAIEGNICQTRFYFEYTPDLNVPNSVNFFNRVCTKQNCDPNPTTQPPTTQATTTQPPTTQATTTPTTFTTTEPTETTTSFTVDTHATPATSSATQDRGLIGNAVGYVKGALSWVNRLATGGMPSQDVVTKDFAYGYQSQEIRSKISRDVWDRYAEVATANYNQGRGYTTPLDIYNQVSR